MPKKHVSDNTKKKVNFDKIDDQIEIAEKNIFASFGSKDLTTPNLLLISEFFFRNFKSINCI